MSKVAVIGVPSSAGARKTGQERAPQSFRKAGLIQRLELAGLEVNDFGDLPEVRYSPDKENPRQQNIPLITSVAEKVADQIERAIKDRAKPVVLGGDCTIAFGVLAGFVPSCPNLGLMYFDGDADMKTPVDSRSGIFDGMGIAHIIGLGDNALSRFGPRNPLMPEDHIVLLGYNEDAGFMTETEHERLDRCSMIKYPIADMRGKADVASRSALAQLESKADQILVHFDVDVIDFAEFPVADVPHERGLGFNEAMDALQVLVSCRKFAGLVITEFNSDRDPGNSHAAKLVDAVVSAVANGYERWDESET